MPTYPAAFSEPVERIEDIPDVPASEHLACEWGNPQACADDNELRARFAGLAVKAYAARTGPDEPPETVIIDLLNDLRHLCDALGIEVDFDYDTHYVAELHGTF